jgi:hypothetical protein
MAFPVLLDKRLSKAYIIPPIPITPDAKGKISERKN